MTAAFVPAAGSAVGGTSLFDIDVANLWGVSENVLSVQDVNWFSDIYIGNNDNLQFADNLAVWLAGTSASVVPEPGTLLVLGLGLVCLCVVRRKRAA